MAEALQLKKEIYEALKSGNLSQAEELSMNAMQEDIRDAAWEDILKIIKFWQNREELFEFKEDVNQGEGLYSDWDKFVDFCEENQVMARKAIFAVKSFVFKRIVEMLIESYRLSPLPDRELLILLGQAFFEIGLIDRAIETLEYTLSLNREDEDPRVYALLGDLYAEVGNQDLAMVMYNEAFYKFPQEMNMEQIEFVTIHKLYEMIRKDGFEKNEIMEWIPVYGYLYNGLSARRNLEYQEYSQLKERILEYERALNIDKKVINIIIPRLINYYIWLFDYYIFQIKAYQAAEKVVARILQLFRAVIAEELVRIKLFGKAEVVFGQMMQEREQYTITKRES